jgi:SOS response regulatory protein OraA/RecX
LKTRLAKIGFDNKLVQAIIDEFIEDKTLDDDGFAEAFVADYTNLKPKGNIFISRELQKRGVAREAIQNALRVRDEKGVARDFLEKKLSKFNLRNPKDRQKVLRRLLSRGFTPAIVYSILDSHEK